MNISHLLAPILKNIKPAVSYEFILRKDYRIHFYTVQNSKYMHNGNELIMRYRDGFTKESTLDFLDPYMEEYTVREFTVVFDDVIKTFVWDPVRTELPHDHPKQLGPVYEWVEV